MALFIADCSSTYVMSTSYELHKKNTEEKQINNSDKTSGKNPEQSEHHNALGAIPEMDLDVIPPHKKKRDKDLKYQNRIRSKTPKTSKE